MPVNCAKSILISFNLILWLAGGTLLVLGTCIFIDPSKIHLFHFVTSDDLNLDFGYYLAYILLSLGGFVFVSGLFGCCGAVRENRYLLVAYVVLLFLLVCIELTVSVVTFIYKDHFLSNLEEKLAGRLVHHYGYKNNEKHASFSEAVDFAQYRFKCCGIKNDGDYLESNWRNESILSAERRNVPLTCCITQDPGEIRFGQLGSASFNQAFLCLIEECIFEGQQFNGQARLPFDHQHRISNAGSPISVVTRVFYGTVEEPWQNPDVKDNLSCQELDESIHATARNKEGCIKEIEIWFKKESTILITVGISSAALQMIGMIFSVCLCRNLNESI